VKNSSEESLKNQVD
jgi:flagellar biosynthesis chaperone FliJ